MESQGHHEAYRKASRTYPWTAANPPSEDIARFPDLQRKYEAPTFQVISRVLKSLTGKRVTPPGSFRK